MTSQGDSTDEEWQLIVEAPPGAGLMVALASRGGAFRESFSMGKAYVEAREEHGASELLDAVVATKPKLDRTHHGSYEEVATYRLEQLRAAVEVLEAKATPAEIDDYKGFVLLLSEKVAAAHSEHGQKVSEGELAALERIRAALHEPATD
jgi:hypothetical protein